MSWHPPRWSPPLQGAPAERAFAIVEQLASELQLEHFQSEAPGLAAGPAGLALFLGYLATLRDSEELWQRARAAFAQALEPVAGRPHPAEDPSLLTGLPGLAWLVQHLPRLVEGDAEAWLEQVDQLVLAAVEGDAWSGPFYYGEGLIGLGTYLLERPPTALAERGIERIVRHLERLAVNDAGGVAWLRPAASFPPANRPECDVYDLGIPRGVGGAIAFLAAASGYTAAHEPALGLLRGASEWLLRQQCLSDPLGRFGALVRPGAPPPPRTRLGWCYGDLGLSLVLHAAARALGDAPLAALATELAQLSTQRGPEDATTEIVDAGFCHGSAGAGHLYARLFDATHDELFLATARRWFELALSLHCEQDSLGGFRAVYSRGDDPTFRPQALPGLLMGSAGIGLMLLSACRPIRPSWDRYFLIRVDGAAPPLPSSERDLAAPAVGAGSPAEPPRSASSG